MITTQISSKNLGEVPQSRTNSLYGLGKKSVFFWLICNLEKEWKWFAKETTPQKCVVSSQNALKVHFHTFSYKFLPLIHFEKRKLETIVAQLQSWWNLKLVLMTCLNYDNNSNLIKKSRVSALITHKQFIWVGKKIGVFLTDLQSWERMEMICQRNHTLKVCSFVTKRSQSTFSYIFIQISSSDSFRAWKVRKHSCTAPILMKFEIGAHDMLKLW
jgi:hypothetical protein